MSAVPTSIAGAHDAFEEATYRKVAWRLIPLLLICYIIAYLDRVNVGFAKLQMLEELGFSETVYGLGAGIFFIGYVIFEVPSNILLHKVGARVWIARIMITWGLIGALMAFVRRRRSSTSGCRARSVSRTAPTATSRSPPTRSRPHRSRTTSCR